MSEGKTVGIGTIDTVQKDCLTKSLICVGTKIEDVVSIDVCPLSKDSLSCNY